MKFVSFGHRFTPITPCTWPRKLRGRPWVPPANSANGQVLMGKQQHLKDGGGEIKAPASQVQYFTWKAEALPVTYVQREAWGKEHTVYASSKAFGPSLSSGPELLFQMPMNVETPSVSACPIQLKGCCVLWYYSPHCQPWVHTRYNRLLEQAPALRHSQI